MTRDLRIRALAFDLDGVLVDSTEHIASVWRIWSDGHGLDTEFVLRTLHGKRTLDVIKSFVPNSDPHGESRLLEELAREVSVEIPAIPGAKELLLSLEESRFPWGIVTSAEKLTALHRLRSAGLSIPTHMIAAEECLTGKPDPLPYQLGASLLGYPTHDIVALEDSPSGLLSAQAAGLQTIALTTTHDRSLLDRADAYAPDLRSIHFQMLHDGWGSLTVSES